MNLINLGSSFFIGLSGPELTSDEKKWLSTEGVAGVVFFSRNIIDPKQLNELISQVTDLCLKSRSGEPPLCCIDMEGGRISELKSPHFRTWPAPSQYHKENPNKLLSEFSLEMGIYLRKLGFHLNFAPCLDVLTNPLNRLIADRALAVNSEQVAFLGRDLIRGFQDAAILTTAKHFPGHGDTLADSHFELPIDLRTWEELQMRALPPFQMASEMGVPFFMMAHVIYPRIDSEWPATLSEIWIKDIMRSRLKISQFCLADDLDMQALNKFGNSNQIAARFFNAGGDFIMYCHRKSPPFEILDYLKSQIKPQEILRLREVQRTISRMKLSFS